MRSVLICLSILLKTCLGFGKAFGKNLQGAISPHPTPICFLSHMGFWGGFDKTEKLGRMVRNLLGPSSPNLVTGNCWIFNFHEFENFRKSLHHQIPPKWSSDLQIGPRISSTPHLHIWKSLGKEIRKTSEDFFRIWEVPKNTWRRSLMFLILISMKHPWPLPGPFAWVVFPYGYPFIFCIMFFKNNS